MVERLAALRVALCRAAASPLLAVALVVALSATGSSAAAASAGLAKLAAVGPVVSAQSDKRPPFHLRPKIRVQRVALGRLILSQGLWGGVKPAPDPA